MRLLLFLIPIACTGVISCKSLNPAGSSLQDGPASIDSQNGQNAVAQIDWNSLRMQTSIIGLIEKDEFLQEMTKVTDSIVKDIKVPGECKAKNIKLERTENDIGGHSEDQYTFIDAMELTVHGKGDFAVCGQPFKPFDDSKRAVTPRVGLGFRLFVEYDISITDWILRAEVIRTRVHAENEFVDALKSLFGGYDFGKTFADDFNDDLSQYQGMNIKKQVLDALGITEIPGTLNYSIVYEDRGILITANHVKNGAE